MMIIRSATPKDIAAIYELLHHELGYAVNPVLFQARFSRMLQAKETYTIFVAEKNDVIIGFLAAARGMALELEADYLRIIGLAVQQDLQGQGIGSMLLEKITEHAVEEGILMLHLTSGLSRKEAHLFYEKKGFSRSGYSFTKTI
ncbi:MAG: GNAT family N-acetyltransferase [Christensenellaceae bacterium]|jgi:GNAT superfamily N-acetyltransferase